MADTRRLLRSLIMLQFTILMVEFFVGMYLNLYSSLPFPISMGAGMPNGGTSLYLHMALGMILFIVALVIVYLAFRSNDRIILINSSLALLFILLSGLSGYLFAFSTGSELLSFMMATGFLLTFLVYIIPVSILIRAPARTS